METEETKWSAVVKPRPVLFSKEMQHGILEGLWDPGEIMLRIFTLVVAI